MMKTLEEERAEMAQEVQEMLAITAEEYTNLHLDLGLELLRTALGEYADEEATTEVAWRHFVYEPLVLAHRWFKHKVGLSEIDEAGTIRIYKDGSVAGVYNMNHLRLFYYTAMHAIVCLWQGIGPHLSYYAKSPNAEDCIIWDSLETVNRANSQRAGLQAQKGGREL